VDTFPACTRSATKNLVKLSYVLCVRLLGFDIFGGDGIAGSVPDPEHTDKRTIFRLFLNIEKDAVNTYSLSIEELPDRWPNSSASEMNGHRAGISSSVRIAAKRFPNHFSARSGETLRIRSKAA
jgi:hypothetical protein